MSNKLFLFTVLLAWTLEFSFRNSSRNSGIVHIVVENVLLLGLVNATLKIRTKPIRFLQMFSLFYFIGCLCYGYFIYFLNKECSSEAPNCLMYGVPFNLGSFCLFLFLNHL